MRRVHSRTLRFEHLERRDLLAVLPGDYDFNGTVEVDDYAVWKANYGEVGVTVAGDGNGDGVVDAGDYVRWRNNLGKTFADVPPDPPKSITVSLATATGVLVSWEASAFADGYVVERRLVGVEENFTDISGIVAGTSYLDAAVTDGNIYEYQVRAINEIDGPVAGGDGGSSPPSPRGSVLVGPAGMTAFRPQQFHDPENPTNAPIYAPYAKRAVAEEDETSATEGPGIRINADDDDMSGTPDNTQGAVQIPLENDLIEVRIDRRPGQGDMVLETGGDMTLYYAYDKSTMVPFQTGTRTQPLNFTNDTVTVFVEWVSANHGNDPLFLRRASNLIILDRLLFDTFHSVVLAFGGNGQVPSDPVADPTNFGVFRTAIELYEEGYDVRMYDEEDIDSAFAGVVNSINRQGYNEVAMYGFSQGGGAVFAISELIEEAADPLNGTITELFTVPFTSYIDAVDHFGFGVQNERPKLSEFHWNQYQTTGLAHGGPLVDPDDDDEEHVRTPLGLKHTDMDDDVNVLNLLKQRLRQKVTR